MSRAALSIHQILLTIYRNIGQLTSVQFAIRGTGSIARAIGQEKAQAAVKAIVDEWGGSLEHIPTGAERTKAERNEEIRRLYRTAKHSVPELANRFGLCEKTVTRILGS